MWTTRLQQEDSGRILKVAIDRNSVAITFAQAIGLLASDGNFRTYMNDLLANCPFEAFRWETPAVTIDTQNQAFEFVLIDSPSLTRSADVTAFEEHFRGAKDAGAVEFGNLGKDAVLVVPTPMVEARAYVHLGAFIRLAPASQRDQLWQLLGSAIRRRLNEKPVWINTAGAGIAWLHIRLDDRPKYYHYAAYKVP